MWLFASCIEFSRMNIMKAWDINNNISVQLEVLIYIIKCIYEIYFGSINRKNINVLSTL